MTPHGTRTRYCSGGCRCLECKAAASEYSRRYHRENRERVAAKNKAWRRENPDYDRQWKRAHPDSVRATRERLWAQHGDKYREQARAYVAANRAKRNAESRAWYEANRARQAEYHRAHAERYRHHKRQRRAREHDAAGACSEEQLAARIAYYGGRCYLCRDAATAVDHVIPLIHGGPNWPANLRPICKRCNSSKGTRSLAEHLAA